MSLLPAVVAAAGACSLGSCAPDLGSSDDARITAPRILAVRADPAEARPGTTTAFTALVASTGGSEATANIAWSFCVAPRPPTTNDAVSPACLSTSSLSPIGDGPSLSAATPGAGCALFGPDAPAGGARPTDPDSTGGYYQPVRADLSGAVPTFALARIMCDLPNASAATAAAFAAAYVPNANPALLPLTAVAAGAAVSLDAVPAGASVELTASWPASSAETYALYDPTSDSVTSARESMTVAWYATAGTMDRESTGRASEDPGTTTTNGWTAPGAPTTSHLWIVLRDSRGGVAFAAYDATVVP